MNTVELAERMRRVGTHAHRRKDENRRVRDADGDTAGSGPSSLDQIYRSCVPWAPGRAGGRMKTGRVGTGAHRRKDEPGRVRDADGDTAGSGPSSSTKFIVAVSPGRRGAQEEG